MKKPTHEEISQRAHRIWQDSGGAARDAGANWTEAERQLNTDSSQHESNPAAAKHPSSRPVSEAQSPTAVAERSAQQKKEARKPKVPTHTGPKAPPPESGKPLWNQPHSS